MGVGMVWKIWLFAPPDSNVWLSLVLLFPLDCAASETYYYPAFPRLSYSLAGSPVEPRSSPRGLSQS